MMELPLSDLSSVKGDAGCFRCDHCDAELVHKIAQLLLPGLATACVDSTTGDFFRSPAMVAVELRHEMIDYITDRSETYISEFLLPAQQAAGGGDSVRDRPPDDPTEVVSDLIEDFVSTKQNFLSRISSWILSDSREDKIDDFVQEMEANRFWTIDRREAVAEVLLRNLDYKNVFHCSLKLEDEQLLAVHKAKCGFRSVSCSNDGCRVKFCAVQHEQHDSVCGYKVLPCEQQCPDLVLRREMDRHCVTICPMKLMNCPFYQVGCKSVIPQCTLEQHCQENLRMHLICVLPVVHRNEELSKEELEGEAEALEQAQSTDELFSGLDLRSLTAAIRNLEVKVKQQDNQKNDS
ncbi:hypothetical protein AXF42_Ash004893 [Apostasia shenzhenica]|uniref:TRAF-type domain-containing protein n=1 Tax=Apostasia shenzhenica TaxID=1088818 RepID=A0A2I0B7V5_9ASPA|nr:hypothetical protein AXF42_Ash004893 [Apostasia shenzhenica]